MDRSGVETRVTTALDQVTATPELAGPLALRHVAANTHTVRRRRLHETACWNQPLDVEQANVLLVADDGGDGRATTYTGGRVTQRSGFQQGRCPVCKRLVALTADGRVPRHNGTIRAYAPPEECPGGGQQAEVTES